MTLVPALLFIILILVILLIAFVSAYFLLLSDHQELIANYKWLRSTYNAAHNGEPAKFKDLTWITK